MVVVILDIEREWWCGMVEGGSCGCLHQKLMVGNNNATDTKTSTEATSANPSTQYVPQLWRLAMNQFIDIERDFCRQEVTYV